MWFWILLGLIALIVISLISMYNSLVSLRNRVRNAYAQMDVQMKNRADLIPGLVETVKGAAGHERGTLEAVMKARSGLMNASTPEQAMQANAEMSNALNRLMAVVESYPDLKANSSFQSLMKELRDAEEKIRYSRQFYNDTVQKYNTKLEMFPTSIIASSFGFKPEKFFEITESERQAPKVDFSGIYDANYNQNDAYTQRVPKSQDPSQAGTPQGTTPVNPVNPVMPNQNTTNPVENDPSFNDPNKMN